MRKWFDHDEKKWSEFKNKYNAELKHSPAGEVIAAYAKKYKTVTLVYSAKDELHNQAVVLKEFLEQNNWILFYQHKYFNNVVKAIKFYILAPDKTPFIFPF